MEPTGYRVVATLQTPESQTPVRFIATLAPEQSVTLSTPRGAGEPAVEACIVRHGEQVFVGGDGMTAGATGARRDPAMR